GLILVTEAKHEVGASGLTNAAALASTAAHWNARMASMGSRSKYVQSTLMDPLTGALEVTFTSNVSGTADGRTLVFSPQIRTGASPAMSLPAYFAASSLDGALDWLCTS